MELPVSLKCLTLGYGFAQGMQAVVLPDGLQELTFGLHNKLSMEGVVLPSGLRHLRFIGCGDRLKGLAPITGLCSLRTNDLLISAE